MKTSKKSRTLTQDEAKSLLHTAKMRISQQRVDILRALHRHPNWHATVDDLFKELSSSRKTVSLATCYRVIHELCHAGLVEHRVLNENRTVYEVAKATRHDHIVHESGTIIEFQEARLNTLLEDIARARGFELLDRQIVLYVRSRSQRRAKTAK